MSMLSILVLYSIARLIKPNPSECLGTILSGPTERSRMCELLNELALELSHDSINTPRYCLVGTAMYWTDVMIAIIN